MEHEPLFEPDSDITRRLEKLDGEGLELYVADLLSTFRPLGWKVYVTKKTYDLGGDLVLDNPDGIRYVIQAKHRQDDEKVIGLAAVQQAVAAKAAYGAHHSIVMSNALDFSEPAKRLAAYNKTILWTKQELQKLYFAAIYHDEKLLQEIGLELGKPIVRVESQDTSELIPYVPSPEPVFTPQLEKSAEQELPLPKESGFVSGSSIKRKSAWVLWGLISLVAFLTVIAIFGPKRGGVISSPSSPLILPPEAVVMQYDRAYRYALSTNDLSDLYKWAFPDYVDKNIVPFVRERQTKGCVLDTQQVSPPRILSMDKNGTNFTVRVEKRWRQTLKCEGLPDRPILDRAFETTYVLRPAENGQIKVSYGEWN
ncbi:MAG TPA: restriction endonuclease [Meiothermus sp.]|nr:restriction endonuclease [Meiothermus sp.]